MASSMSAAAISASQEQEGFQLPLGGTPHNSDSNVKSPWSRKIVLSLDGGGVRGYASLYILKKLMEQIQNEEEQLDGPGWPSCSCSASYPWNTEAEQQGPNAIPETWRTRYLPHHYIDYFVGTSTGGLTAVMLGRLQMDVDEAMERYDDVGTKVFKKPRTVTRLGPVRSQFKSRHMEDVLQYATQQDVIQRIQSPQNHDVASDRDYLAEADKVHLRTESADVARTAIVAFGGYRSKRAYVFRSYDHPVPQDPENMKYHINPGAASDVPLWRVARATSAAPGYFSAMKYAGAIYQDGAVAGHNNPVQLAFTEVDQMHWRHLPRLIISVGTGQKPEVEGKKGLLHRMTPHNMSNMWAAVKNFKKSVLDSHEKHEEFKKVINERNRGLRERGVPLIQYVRLDVSQVQGRPELSKIKLGEWKGKDGATTKTAIRDAVDAWLRPENSDARQHLKECAELMVKCRRERARTERWERKALHLIYCCSVTGCEAPPFNSRGKLRAHAMSDHGFVRQIRSVRSNAETAAEYSCYWDHCGDTQVSAFDDADDFLEHLQRDHGIREPQLKNLEEFEQWLSRCRRLKQTPVSRSATANTRANTGLSQQQR